MMMEAPPASTFEMIQTQLVLHFLEVPLNAPAHLEQGNQLGCAGGLGSGGKPISSRLFLALRPFDHQPFFFMRSSSPVVTMGRTHAAPGETRSHGTASTFSPSNAPIGLIGKLSGELQDATWALLLGATQQRRGAAGPFPLRWRQWALAGSPDRGLFRDPYRVGQAAGCQRLAKLEGYSVPGIGYHRRGRQLLGEQHVNLRQRNLPLGSKLYLARNPRSLPTNLISAPGLRKIELPRAWNAHHAVGQRHHHSDLTGVLPAQGTAILPNHSHRMPTLLRKTSVVHDPGRYRPMTLQLCQRHLSRHRQHRPLRPSGLCYEVVHRLMSSPNMTGIDPRRHRFHALALARQQKPRQIGAQRLSPVCMAERVPKPLHVLLKALLGT